MNIPISKKLLCCAQMVAPGARVADIGTDHGYLAIYLTAENIATVIASDLREKPLQRAMQNAERFGLSDRIRFRLSDGLQAYAPDEIDTVVCAGMGGDLMIEILNEADWLRKKTYSLILQPQSGGQDVRRYLAHNGFAICRERLVEQSGFLYTVLKAAWTGAVYEPGAGDCYASPALRKEGGKLLPLYLRRLIESLRATLAQMENSRTAVDADKQRRFQQALSDLMQMEAEL